MAIYLSYSDLSGFIVESCRQIVDEKVTFGVVSVNHSEGDVIQTYSRKLAEKYFFKCPIKTHFSNVPLKPIPLNPKYLYTQTLKTAWVGPEPVKS